MKGNNNPRNNKRYLEFLKMQREMIARTEDEARQNRIQNNMERWMRQVPEALRGAKPQNLHEDTIEKIKGTSLTYPYNKYVLISGSSTIPPTYTTYAILHELIRTGHISPSEIKMTSLIEGYNNIHGMYEARAWKNYFFDEKAKVLIVEGASKSLTHLASKGEDQFWRELYEFTRYGNRLLIITYITDEPEQEQRVLIPSLTSERELNTRLVGKCSFIRLTKEEEEKIHDEQRKAYQSI